jgi:acetolactate synthase small subunit
MVLVAFFSMGVMGVESIVSQNTLESNTEVKFKTNTYFYTFSVEVNSESTETAKAQIEKLLNVAKVKLNYKAEKGQGQFIIVVREPARTSEQEEIFSIKWVKEVLENNNLTPVQYSYE